MTKLDIFLQSERDYMIQDLTSIIKDLQSQIKDNPDWYIEHGTDSPSIDIRLCIDLDRRGEATWLFRTGSVDYDSYHSEHCSASSIGLDTDAESLLSELVNQLDEV